MSVVMGAICVFGQVLFEEDFREKLAEGWSWVRENPAAWRAGEHGLEIHVEPGNLWGGANDAKNVLVRPLPEVEEGKTLVAEVTVENVPTHQYEQVNLVWYYGDSNMVKIGLELVDGQISLVMGREEADKARTICIIPLTKTVVQVRLQAKGRHLEGFFREEAAGDWRKAGECDLPVKGEAKISLQAYQGPADAVHWARLSEMRVYIGAS